MPSMGMGARSLWAAPASPEPSEPSTFAERSESFRLSGASGAFRSGRSLRVSGVPEDLVTLHEPLPLFAALAAVERPVDPGEEVRREGRAEPVPAGSRRPRGRPARCHRAQARSRRGSSRGARTASPIAAICAASSRMWAAPAPDAALVGHARRPLHEPGPEQSREGHQHEAHRAVGPTEVPPAMGEAIGDHVRVHRIEHQHRPGIHAEGPRRHRSSTRSSPPPAASDGPRACSRRPGK